MDLLRVHGTNDTGAPTVVERARLRDVQLIEKQRLMAAFPAIRTLHHMDGAHDYEHHGDIVTYLRLKGITPHSPQR